jgi:hypothetical protein
MILRRSASIFCLLLTGTLTLALHAEEKPKQQAKDLAEKAKGEGSDRAQQVRDYCAAAQLDLKNGKYVDTCNSFRSGLSQDDAAFLASAIAAYKSHDLDRAESQARLVTSYDPKLSGQANFLLSRIKNEKILNQLLAAWNRGDFQAVNTLAQGITEPDAKAVASQYVNNVSQYKTLIDQAQKQASSNPQEAIKQYTQAKNLNPNGPGDPAGKIAELQKAPQAKGGPVTPPVKTAAESSADVAKKISSALDDARNHEKLGQLQDALNAYAVVLKLQPGNQDAQSNTTRIEQLIKNDPAAARKELAAAIRYFYSSQFDDAQRALMNYLEAPQTAKNPGVADFYLGATLIERSMLQATLAQWTGPSAEALSAFQAARKANYSPMRTYVSPAVLKVWDSIAP